MHFDHTRNRLLAALSPSALGGLTPHLAVVEWKRGQILVQPDEPIDHAWFPVRGLASVLTVTSGRRRFEVGMYGREGVGPAPVVLGEDRTPNQHVVQADGAALTIARPRLAEAMADSPELRGLLTRYVDVFTVQVGCTALSNGSGTIGDRLARWLLMYHDRLETDDLPLTEEILGIMLGKSRSDIAKAVGVLQRSGAIRASKSTIHILDRRVLETAAGESYGVPEAEYERLIDPVRAPRPGRVARAS